MPVISRASWGADESWRICESNDVAAGRCSADQLNKEKWPQTKAPVKKIILHETGSDSDGGTVKSIYRDHAIVRQWGDIGYHYLIDKQGNVYEGRYGGDGVVGGHTWYGYTDAAIGIKVSYNFNIGTIGIAVLGNFDKDPLPDNVRKVIEDLLLEKSLKFNIDPAKRDPWEIPLKVTLPVGKSFSDGEIRAALERSTRMVKGKGFEVVTNFTDVNNPRLTMLNVPNIITHRDIDQTNDPPLLLYNAISIARVNAEARFSASLVLAGEPVLNEWPRLFEHEKRLMTVQFKNIGSETWRQGEILLASRNKILKDKSWPLPFLGASFVESEVKKGEVANFSFIINTPDTDYVSEEYYLVKAVTQNGAVLGYERIGGPSYTTVLNIEANLQGEVTDIVWPEQLAAFSRKEVMVKIKNTGREVWRQSEVGLKVKPANGTARSELYDSRDWLNRETAATLLTKRVRPGEVGLFKFMVHAPAKPKEIKNAISLYKGKITLRLNKQKELVYATTVTPAPPKPPAKKSAAIKKSAVKPSAAIKQTSASR